MNFDPAKWSLDSDLHEALLQGSAVWPLLRQARIFMTGGTGLIGTWLLELLKAADHYHGLDLRVEILTRDPESFQKKSPSLFSYPQFIFRKGDVLSDSKIEGSFSHFIHAATDASADLNEKNPLKMFDTIFQGTRWALDFAAYNKIERMLFLSSGAVYGQQPSEITHIEESYFGGPDCTDPRCAYAEGKRAAEMLCAIYAKQFGLNITTARIFAVLGPYLPLDRHFAVGNFIRDSLAGQPIIIKSDGRASRSYLYMSDLSVWLLNILVKAQPGSVYNVGSEHSVSISDLAGMVSDLLGGRGVKVLGRPDEGWNAGRYVPGIQRIHEDLGVKPSVSLEQAILRTASWYGWGKLK